MIDFDLFARIIQASGAPGHERLVRKMIVPLLEGLCDEVYTDRTDNLIARRKGSGPEELKSYSFL